MWRRTVDQIVRLSLAYHDIAGTAGDRSAQAEVPVRHDAGLGGQLMSAHRRLAEIEAALGRLKAGGYGSCERCAKTMGADWLIAGPLVRYCPACIGHRHGEASWRLDNGRTRAGRELAAAG